MDRFYGLIQSKQAAGETLTIREREFLSQYAQALEETGTARAKVRKENKYPKRKKATHANGGVGAQIGAAL